MTILNVKDDYGRHTGPGAFMINYTDDDCELLHQLHQKYNKGHYTEGSTDQAMVSIYDWLPKRVKKKLNVDELTISYENYKNDGWKLLCKKGLQPRKYYDDKHIQFFEHPKWHRIDDEVLPENIMAHIEPVQINNKDDIKESTMFEDKTITYMTDLVLTLKLNGEYVINRRICCGDEHCINAWRWDNDSDDMVAWLQIPKF